MSSVGTSHAPQGFAITPAFPERAASLIATVRVRLGFVYGRDTGPPFMDRASADTGANYREDPS